MSKFRWRKEGDTKAVLYYNEIAQTSVEFKHGIWQEIDTNGEKTERQNLDFFSLITLIENQFFPVGSSGSGSVFRNYPHIIKTS